MNEKKNGFRPLPPYLFRETSALLRLEEIFLRVRANLNNSARAHEPPDRLPVFPVPRQPNQKVAVLMEGPATLHPLRPANRTRNSVRRARGGGLKHSELQASEDA